MPDDGTVQAGATLSYTDNGDGTITDNNTGLMWEKKDDAGGLHDKDNSYVWSGGGLQETIWDWLEDVNATGFAGHHDWRIPSVKELMSIVNYQNVGPAVSAEFNNFLTSSFTRSGGGYWSSTPNANSPFFAWTVAFGAGEVNIYDKTNGFYVRAVRGGP